MQNKIVTLIASVLKPVDDTRMFEKIGLSLHQSNKYEVNIIGFQTKNKSLYPNIHMIQAFGFSRLSVARLFAPIKFLRLALSIKPQLLIITTHELILAAVVYKCLVRKARLVYDIQENYYRNMVHQGGFSKPASLVLGIAIRIIEILSTIFFSNYILAENTYNTELNFSNTKSVIVLNKFKTVKVDTINQAFSKAESTKASIKLIYSGTIHQVYGVLEAIELANNLTKLLNTKMLIVGCTKDFKLLKTLAAMETQYPWLQLCVDTTPIPHPQIIRCIQQADFGIVSHQPVPSIAGCFPTRIYELMAYQKPILLQDHTPWTRYCNRWDSAIAFDYNRFDAAWIAEQMITRKFYQYGIPNDIYWESEEKKLLTSLDQLFGK